MLPGYIDYQVEQALRRYGCRNEAQKLTSAPINGHNCSRT
jgi:hypothetical protein